MLTISKECLATSLHLTDLKLFVLNNVNFRNYLEVNL